MEVTEEHLGYAKMISKMMVTRTRHPELFDEFYQVACETLITEIPRYDPAKGMSLKTFLTNRMHYRIVDHIRVETGRSEGSMRNHEIAFSPVDDLDEDYFAPFTRPDPDWRKGFDEIDDEDERVRALTWAVDVLAEELSAARLEAVRAWMREGTLRSAGESIGKSESYICLCVQEAERVLAERRDEVLQLSA